MIPVPDAVESLDSDQQERYAALRLAADVMNADREPLDTVPIASTYPLLDIAKFIYQGSDELEDEEEEDGTDG